MSILRREVPKILCIVTALTLPFTVLRNFLGYKAPPPPGTSSRPQATTKAFNSALVHRALRFMSLRKWFLLFCLRTTGRLPASFTVISVSSPYANETFLQRSCSFYSITHARLAGRSKVFLYKMVIARLRGRYNRAGSPSLKLAWRVGSLSIEGAAHHMTILF